MKFQFTPVGVCSQHIEFDIDKDGMLHNLTFVGGCHGNTQGLVALAEGRPAEEVSKCLAGINCRGRGTSCPDQLSKALREALLAVEQA